jgi:hypothetical protein
MNLTQIKEEQASFIAKNYCMKNACASHSECTGIFSIMKDLSILDLHSSLGALGEKLKAFADLIDLNHPDLRDVCKGELVGLEGDTFSNRAIDLIKIFELVKKQNVSPAFVDHIKGWLSNHPSLPLIDQEISSPIENQRHVRLLKSKQQRDFIRATKRKQSINFALFFDSNYWDSLLSSFSLFARFENQLSHEILQSIERKKLFLEHGLSFVANQLEKTISDMEVQAAKRSYYGFNKITLTHAAYTLAKMHGFETNTQSTSTFYYLPEDKFAFPVKLKNGKQLKMSAMSYPYHEINEHASEEIKNLIQHLDSFPQIGNRPLFDHFRVVFTGIDCSYCPEILSLIKNQENFSQPKNFYEAEKFLFHFLTQKGYMIGVLLGERDGEHYFISYFL